MLGAQYILTTHHLIQFELITGLTHVLLVLTIAQWGQEKLPDDLVTALHRLPGMEPVTTAETVGVEEAEVVDAEDAEGMEGMECNEPTE